MSPVADDLRLSLRRRLAALSPEARLELTARLADMDLELFCAAVGVSREAGRRLLARRRQTGRRPSRAAGVESP